MDWLDWILFGVCFLVSIPVGFCFVVGMEADRRCASKIDH